jgi:hypothetical protein
MKIDGNVSHAEHQFVAWLESQPSLLPQIASMHLNLREYSPCATCIGDLVRLIRAVVAARDQRPFGHGRRMADAVLTWVTPYPGRGSDGLNSTTSAGVRALEGAGWTIHAPKILEGKGTDLHLNTDIILTAPDYRRPQ